MMGVVVVVVAGEGHEERETEARGRGRVGGGLHHTTAAGVQDGRHAPATVFAGLSKTQTLLDSTLLLKPKLPSRLG